MSSYLRAATAGFLVFGLLIGPVVAQEKQTIAAEARAGEVWSVSVARDNRTLALARGFSGAGGAIVLWDLVANTKEVLAEEEKAVLTVAFAPDGQRLAAG